MNIQEQEDATNTSSGGRSYYRTLCTQKTGDLVGVSVEIITLSIYMYSIPSKRVSSYLNQLSAVHNDYCESELSALLYYHVISIKKLFPQKKK